MTNAARQSNFYWGFLFLSPAKRRALTAVYAFARTVDDIVDAGHLKEEEQKKMLAFWKAEVHRMFAGQPTHSLSQELWRHVQAFHLPKEPFLELIAGCELDLDHKRYETFEELEKYLYGVAVTVGLLCVRIFGYERTSPDDIREYARNMGYAVQLTNILRDVGADLELGRVYIPASDMTEAGYSAEALLRREHNAAFDRLMQALYRRAQTYYQRARSLVDFRDRPALLPAEVMAHIYEALLEDIRRDDFRVLFHRHSLPPWRKAVLAGKAWLYCHGL